MTRRAARRGLIAALCALPLAACSDSGALPPGEASQSEVQALADAQEMLDERVPEAEAPAAEPAP